MTEIARTQYVRRRIDTLEGQIAAARKRLRIGTPGERVDARGDLEVLQRRQASLVERLAEIESGGVDSIWERVGASFEKDVALLEDDLKRWMDGLD